MERGTGCYRARSSTSTAAAAPLLAKPGDAPREEGCAGLDIRPTGPLWGRESDRPVPALEAEVVAHHDVLARGLSKAGLEAERRALRIRVDRLAWAIEGEVVQLRFRLFRGAFATAVLHELLENAFAQDTPEAEE